MCTTATTVKIIYVRYKGDRYLDMLSVRILQSERADVVRAHAQHLSDRSAPSGRSSRVTVLRHVWNSRSKMLELPNIFAPKGRAKPS